MAKTKEELHIKIRDRLDEKGWTKTDLANSAQLPLSTISYLVEGSVNNPKIDTLKKVAKCLNLSVAELIGETTTIVNTKDEGKPLKPKADTQSTGKVPLLDWDKVKFWCSKGYKYLSKDHSQWVRSDLDLSPSTFALQVAYEARGVFPRHSIIIADPKADYSFGDYVLASHNNKKPTIQTVFESDEIPYLNSVGYNLPAVPISKEHKVIATIKELHVHLPQNVYPISL